MHACFPIHMRLPYSGMSAAVALLHVWTYQNELVKNRLITICNPREKRLHYITADEGMIEVVDMYLAAAVCRIIVKRSGSPRAELPAKQ